MLHVFILAALSSLDFLPFHYKITKMSDFNYDRIYCYSDIFTCYSVSLLKLLESVISKLSIQIIWTSIFFIFHHFQERQILKTVSSSYKMMHISDQRNHWLK